MEIQDLAFLPANKKPEKKLEWNVLCRGLNSNKIEIKNIFNYHSRFMQDLYKNKKRYLKRNNLDFDGFFERVDKDLRYYFWSKSEYEIILTSWPPHLSSEELDRLNREREEDIKKGYKSSFLIPNLDISEKIDIYDQIKMNWEAFKLYLMTNYKLIKKVEF